MGKDRALADWYKRDATQDYLLAQVKLDEPEGVASLRAVMIRPGRKPAPPVRSSWPAESNGEASCELALSDLRKYIALHDSFPPASWRKRNCLPTPELRGAGVQEETLDVSTGGRLPLVKPSRLIHSNEAAVVAPRESLEKEIPELATLGRGRTTLAAPDWNICCRWR